MIIYKAVNKINGKVYVGQTVKPLHRRLANHHCTKSGIFPRALKKYGEKNFTIEPTAWCYTKEHLDFLEKFYIDLFNCKTPNGYNLTDGGGGILGHHHSEETKKKMARHMFGVDNPSYGGLSEEHKRKVIEAIKGRHHSEETKRKQAFHMLGDKNPMKRPEVAKKHGDSIRGEKHQFWGKFGADHPSFGKRYIQKKRRENIESDQRQ